MAVESKSFRPVTLRAPEASRGAAYQSEKSPCGLMWVSCTCTAFKIFKNALFSEGFQNASETQDQGSL